MAIFAPMELELFPVAAGATLYAIYVIIFNFRRSQERPKPIAKLAADTVFAEGAQLEAVGASGNDRNDQSSIEPCAEPEAEEDLAALVAKPAAEPQGASGLRSSGFMWSSAGEHQRKVVKATAVNQPQTQKLASPTGKHTSLILSAALTLWGGMVLAEQLRASEAKYPELADAEPSVDCPDKVTSGPPDIELPGLPCVEPFCPVDAALLSGPETTKVVAPPAASPGAEELSAAGYSVNSKGLVTLSLTRQQTTTQTIDDVTYYKSAYWGIVYVGTPAVPYKVVFDTGSGHLVLPSTYCHSETCKVHKRYWRSGSSTAKDIDYDGTPVAKGQARDQITVSFGTGEITGVFVEDVVCVEDSAESLENSSTTNNSSTTDIVPALAGDSPEKDKEKECMTMRIIAATAMSEQPFKTFKFDGILGLGLDSLSQAPEFNFIHIIAQTLGAAHGNRHAHIFAVFLGEHREEESEVTIGGWADEHLLDDEELLWRPVHEPEHGHWMIQISALYVNDKRIAFCDGEERCKAVADTGTSLMAVPTAVFPELFDALKHNVTDDFRCNGQGPKLHFELGGKFNVTMDSQDYSRYQELKRKSPLRHREEFGARKPYKPGPQQMAYCKPMLMTLDLPAPIGPKLFILGEPVLRKYYTVYDAGEKRVGFGRAKHAEAPPPMQEDEDAWFWDDDE